MKLRTRMCAFLVLILACLGVNHARSFAEEVNPEEKAKVNLTSCSCHVMDPIGNLGCAPLPIKAKGDAFPDTSCPLAWSALNKSMKSVSDSARFLYGKTNIKTPEETLDYLSCYAERAYEKSKNGKIPPRNLFCHFKTTLAPQIALAAESAGLPFAVQACMFFRESMFDPDAVSPKGATGYVQFMPNTIKQMGTITRLPAEFFEKKIKDTEALKLEAQIKLTTKVSTMTQTRLEKDINHYDALICVWKANLAAKRTWDRYWAGTPNADIKIGPNSVKCPQVAFALSAMKQTYDLNLLTGNYGSKYKPSNSAQDTLSINKMSERDSALLLAGAYNAGLTGLASKCGGVTDLSKCIAKLPGETRGYIESIRACSEKDSNAPMTHFDQKKCEDFKCRK